MATFIFGHKSPDTDSVCASIALSYLYNEMGKNTLPKVLGHLNNESKFVLSYFKVKEPDYLNNTKVRVKDIKYNKKAFVYENDSINSTFNLMQKFNITAVPIVDTNKVLKGLVTLKEIAKYLISGNKNAVETSYNNIIEALDGSALLKFDEEIKGELLIASFQSKTFQDEVELNQNNILIVGDRFKIIDYAIDSKVKLIVLTGNHEFPLKLLKKAEKNKVNIICSSLGSFDTTNKVILSNRVKSININSKPITINNKDYRTDVISLANRIGHTNYPVINNKGECLGILKITSTDNYTKQEVILVDHNGLSQSALGIEEAVITEIIDHHNLSSIGTNVPINFRSMPVGCTCTIIYNMFVENKVNIPQDIAGLMLSAILSDTLIFKSPTTTEDDIFAASKLAKIAKVDIDQYGYEMFKAASSIKGLSVNDIINGDFKSYSVGGAEIALSQIMTLDFNEIEENMDEFVTRLNDLAYNKYMVVALFITDIYKNGSYIIYNDAAKEIIQDAFDIKDIHEGVYVSDLVSRKKQMLPAILEVVEKRV